jgi:hypothetical protein
MVRFISASFLVLLAVMAGCRLEPDYPLSVMTFDEGLVGTWESTGEGGEKSRLRIEPREVEVHDGRLNGSTTALGVTSTAGENTSKAQAYRMVGVDSSGKELAFIGYLVSFGGDRLLGVQFAEPDKFGMPLATVIPVHHLWKIDRRGDELRIWSPRVPVAWVPLVQWVDAGPPPRDGSFPPMESTEGERKLYVTNSIDRVLEIYRRYGRDPDFWLPETVRSMRRVGP